MRLLMAGPPGGRDLLTLRAPSPFLAHCHRRPSSRPQMVRAVSSARPRTSLDDWQSDGPSLGGMLGGSSNGARGSGSAPPPMDVNDVPLNSEAKQDYTKLQSLLKAGDFQGADDETRALLISLAGPEARHRNWVYWSEVAAIPEADLKTVDALWSAASGGRFGFTAQRQVWTQHRRRWVEFFKAINWVAGEYNMYRKWPQEFIYSTEACKGHLPLTNALRGTRLMEALLEHPAIAGLTKERAGEVVGGNGTEARTQGSKLPDWLS
ncbi:GUN4 [Auxenochlorella protothecoides x Auxenochlorella symbiontica]|uniref:GUN4-like domain-containing protein n=3 Tax=Auxenochlorella protothecoides TaxID=3075 RepID=A0A1D2A2Y8_AUXPR